MYLGNEELAGHATERAFANYFRSEGSLEMDDFPLGLWCSTIEAARNCEKKDPFIGFAAKFRAALLQLAPDERVVFLLHFVLGLELSSIMLLGNWGPHQLRQLSAAGLLKVRRFLGFSVQSSANKPEEDPRTIGVSA
jgi:hypothetical protein